MAEPKKPGLRLSTSKECELSGGHLVEDIDPAMAADLFEEVLDHPGDWWTGGSDIRYISM